MKIGRQKIYILLVLILGNLTVHGQADQHIGGACSQWEHFLDTTENLDLLEVRSKAELKDSEGACKVKILYALGDLYVQLSKLDTAQFYYDLSIEVGETESIWDYLIIALCKRAKVELTRNELDSAAHFLGRAGSIIAKGHGEDSKDSYYSYMASLMDDRNDYFAAIAYCDSAFMVNKGVNADASNTLHNKGVYYFRLGNFQEAIKQILSAIEINQTITNGDLEANYFVLGFLYTKTKQYEASAQSLEKALELTQKNKRTLLEQQISTTLAGTYRLSKNSEKAIENADHALSLIDLLDDPFNASKAYLERGKISEFLQNRNEEALNYYELSYNTVKDFSAFSRYSPTKELAEFYIKKKQFAKANPFIDELIDITTELKRVDYLALTEKLQSEYYEGLNQPAVALTHLKKYHLLNDSISNKEVLKQTAYYEREFDSKQKAIDILQLNEANRKQKEATQVAEILQRRYLYGAGFLGLLFMIGAYSAYTLNRQKKSLEEAHQKLSELNGIKDRFFSIIAHDLRGMIVPFQRAGKILGYHIEKGNTDRAKVLSNELGKNANQLSDMLDNLLKWSLNQMDGYRVNLEKMNIQEEFDTIRSNFEQIAQYKSTQMHLTGNGQNEILFDKNAFHVIFRNLIGNALKYTEQGDVHVSWKQSADYLEFKVKDTGVGIDDKHLAALFKLAHKERKTGTKGEKGTGLGLHLVHQFVNRLNGTINIESELNQGTTFFLQFPLKTETQN